MKKLIGIDLGTSSLKGILTDGSGHVLRQASRTYEILRPKPGFTEQDPALWLSAFYSVMKELTDGTDGICGISFAGQMHGLVILDRNGQVIRPCILWNDARTEKQTLYLNSIFGKERLSAETGNIAFAGFTAPKLLWLFENERDNFNRIDKIMLPKDYLTFLLTGVHTTDYSDAGGTLLLDCEHRRWSDVMCKLCHIKPSQLPCLYESGEAVGTVLPEIARQLGLSDKVTVAAGAGDNAAAAVGTGTVKDGDCTISLGTSGTVFIACDHFSADKENALHSFPHATGKWHLMGCILSAASCRKWWLEQVLGETDYKIDDRRAAEAETGELLFLPYLCGERSPHNDTSARGSFIGISAETSKGQMSRAVMEGVAFAIRDCFEVARKNGVCPTSARLCGGGAKGKIWRQIIADITGLPVFVSQTEQGPALGASIFAMVACGLYPDVKTASENVVCECETILSNAELAAYYEKKYRRFSALYPALRSVLSQ